MSLLRVLSYREKVIELYSLLLYGHMKYLAISAMLFFIIYEMIQSSVCLLMPYVSLPPCRCCAICAMLSIRFIYSRLFDVFAMLPPSPVAPRLDSLLPASFRSPSSYLRVFFDIF